MTTNNHAKPAALRELNAAELDSVAGGKKIAMVTLHVAGMIITSNYDSETSTVSATVKVGSTYYGVAAPV